MRMGFGRLWVAAVVLACAGMVHAEDDPLNDPSVLKSLRAMADASTWYHPDQFGEFAGMRYYAHRQYQDADEVLRDRRLLRRQAVAAEHRAHVSQRRRRRQGSVTAYAWFGVAAERDYPHSSRRAIAPRRR